MPTEVSFDDYRKEWLKDVEAGNPSTTELGNRFCRKLLLQWLEIGESSDDLVFCDGSGDGGIDVACLVHGETGEGEGEPVTSGDTWYLVQSKYGSAFRGTNTLLEESQKVIDTLDGRRQRLSSLAEGLLERLTIFRRKAVEGQDKMVLLFATEAPLTETQKRVLDDVRNMGRGRVGAVFDVESVSIATIHQRQGEQDLRPLEPQWRVCLRTNVVPSGADLLVGSTPLFDLYEFLKSYRSATDDLDQLYEKNVRRFLGGRRKVNIAIQKTLKETPDRFGLYNNGITIVVRDYSRKDNDLLELHDPYVVNGCQTTRTVWEVFHQRMEAGGTGTDPEMEEWKGKACKGVVVTKIVKVGPDGESLLQAITRHTNSQNAVREKDFLSLQSDFRTWASQMADQHKVFLEVQRGGWESQCALQKQKPDSRKFEQYANAFDLLKVYGAGWLGEAGTAFGRNAAFVPGGSIFKRIVGPEGKGSDDEAFGVEDLYAALCLSKAAERFEFGRGTKYASRRQTRFLFFMVVIELLKDVMIRSQQPVCQKDITRALARLFRPERKDAQNALLDAAVEVVDEYLTPNEDDSVHKEPSYEAMNSDLNAYLKWEKMGKTDEGSPRFRSLLAAHKRTLGRRAGDRPSPRELITKAILPEQQVPDAESGG